MTCSTAGQPGPCETAARGPSNKHSSSEKRQAPAATHCLGIQRGAQRLWVAAQCCPICWACWLARWLQVHRLPGIGGPWGRLGGLQSARQSCGAGHRRGAPIWRPPCWPAHIRSTGIAGVTSLLGGGGLGGCLGADPCRRPGGQLARSPDSTLPPHCMPLQAQHPLPNTGCESVPPQNGPLRRLTPAASPNE